MSTSTRPVPLHQRRRIVLIYGLSTAAVALTFLLGIAEGERVDAPLWGLALVGVLISLWSGGQLRSREWGFYNWKSQPTALDERQQARALWAVAQTHRIITVALAVLWVVLSFFAGISDGGGMVRRLSYLLLMTVGLMGMLPTAILAWTEPDLTDEEIPSPK